MWQSVPALNGPKLHFCFLKGFFLWTQVTLPPLALLLAETGHFTESAMLSWSCLVSLTASVCSDSDVRAMVCQTSVLALRGFCEEQNCAFQV